MDQEFIIGSIIQFNPIDWKETQTRNISLIQLL